MTPGKNKQVFFRVGEGPLVQGVIKTRFFFLDDKAACLISHGKGEDGPFQGEGASHLVKGCVFPFPNVRTLFVTTAFSLGAAYVSHVARSVSATLSFGTQPR